MQTRLLYSSLYAHLDKKPYSVMVGARQTGKTTLIKQLRKQAEAEGKVTTFLTLEDKDILSQLNL